MRYALMERWNDCPHSFIFGFGEMTLTLAYFTAITGLGFDGDAVPLDFRYQTVALGAELVATLLGVTTHTRYTSQGYVSYEVVYKFWVEQIRVRLASWRELPADVKPAAPAYTREERDQAARSFIFCIISSQHLCTSQNKGDSAVLACLQDLSLVDTYDWASLTLAHLYHGLDVWAYEYRIYPGGPESDTLAEARRIPRYLLFLTLWEGDAWTTYAPRVRADTDPTSSITYGAQANNEHNNGNPLVLPSGPITRSRAKEYGATMSLYIQEQVTQELHDLVFNKCYEELEGTPKFLTLMEAHVESEILAHSTPVLGIREDTRQHARAPPQARPCSVLTLNCRTKLCTHAGASI
ncbi:hypothetical protein JCGZ_03697 [Jatropha curcas]|uniref:Aminotransferase-like plant mobile domain-containing protein n=1 Tax=Jatropha curcas TaxID=180498 RepID=A0A067L4I8_JATCU|nr:hypothetical protein JCGZ_03697 [Jatropha curcas]